MKTIAQQLSEKTYIELAKPEIPQQRSRTWQNPEGYRYLVQWSNTVLLRFLVRKLTDNLVKAEYRRKAQLDDAGSQSTTSEYIQFIGYSQGSLEEVKGDIRELSEDGFLASRPGSSLADLGINLGDFNRALRGNKGKTPLISLKNPITSFKKPLSPPWTYQHLTVLYPPLKTIRPQDLTYEMFMELINKTDWLLRKLVNSLEKKLTADQKGYQIERARIRSNLKLR